ncbi:MAG: adenylate/guanylate cyclase domain-containing protein [Microcoleaceae cyanobacterium]
MKLPKKIDTLRNKLIISFLIVALIPLLLLTVISKEITQKTLTENGNKNLSAIAQKIAFNIDTFIETNKNHVRVEAMLPGLSKYLILSPEERVNSPEEKVVIDILRSLSRRDNINIFSYGILDLEGQNIMDTYTPDIGKNESQFDYFQETINQGFPYASSVHIFEISEKQTRLQIYFSSLIRNEKDEKVGVLRVCYNATAIQQFISQETGIPDSKSFAILLDDNYIYLAHGSHFDLTLKSVVPLPSYLLQKLQAQGRLLNIKPENNSVNLPELKKALDNYNQTPFAIVRLPETNNQYNAIAIAKMKEKPWFVIFSQPQSVFLGLIEAQTHTALLLALIMGVIVTIIAIILGENLANPILILTQYVSQFTAGDVTIRVPVKSQDEIGTLANTFNKMMERINIYTENLEVKNAALSKAEAQLRETKSRLSQFLEAMPVGIFVSDAQGHPYYTNNLGKELLSQGIISPIESEQLLQINQIYKMRTNETYPLDDLPIFKALNGESTYVCDLEIALNNKKVPLEVWGKPIFDEEGNVAYAIIAFQDITERVTIEEERAHWIDEMFKINCDLELALELESNLTKSYGRFVPHQFLYFLGHESILDVKLGDQIQKEMSVLFADIRDFTELSEKMTPAENFKFINAYLRRMEPCITAHNGFIDKYIGDAIMALFSGNADEAVKAAIAMLHCLTEYNQHRSNIGYDSIKIGIGINTGILMLGTVGGENRMEGTVISDTVNLASRVENLTKNYGVSLLITQQTFDKLENPRDYAIRMIDTVKVKGKSIEVTIYEVFDADPPEIKEAKFATIDLFLEAFDFWRKQQYQQARYCFQECLLRNPSDTVAQIYLQYCHDILQN